MNNGMRTGYESSEKIPLAELEVLGVPPEVITLLEEGMSTIWLDDLPSTMVLRKALSDIKGMGPKRINRVVGAIREIRKNKENER